MKLRVIDGEKISFNTKKINLIEGLLNFINEKDIDIFLKKNKISYCYEVFYKFLCSNEFNDLYQKILIDISKKFRTKNFYYQRVPSFRIHKKGSKSVEYHNDVMYGHGKEVINVWVPLTNTNKHNALWLSNIEKSNELMKEFKDKEMTIPQANKIFKRYSSPQIMNYGEILFFNTATMHGTKNNQSNKNRVSFDFRILEKGKSSGVKSLHGLYDSFFEKKKNSKECIFYMYQKNPIMENCSHEIQREILRHYAKNNSFYNTIEETEIHEVDHYPNLKYYIENSDIKDILITSILCLPMKKDLRKEILKTAKKNGKNLHFALENITNKKSMIWLNKYYETSVNFFKKNN